MFLTADFPDPERVGSAVSSLLAAGLEQNEIEVFSLRPVPLAPGLLDRPSRISLVAVLSAIINGSLATAFVYYTQRDYPLVTGGMPIVSAWSTGVISYELTMAGAVAGTVLAFLWEAGLFRRRKGRPRPELKEGSIFVQVRCAESAAATAAECLTRAGALTVARAQEA